MADDHPDLGPRLRQLFLCTGPRGRNEMRHLVLAVLYRALNPTNQHEEEADSERDYLLPSWHSNLTLISCWWKHGV